MLALFCLAGSSAGAQTFTQGNLKYTITDAGAKTVSVAKANNNISGSLVLPTNVTNQGVTYTVTSVPESGFEAVGITSLTIPASVTSIEALAFSRCSSLTNVRFEPSSEKLSMVGGYYGSFANSGNDMEVFVDREMEPSGSTPFSSAKVSNVVIGPNVAAITPYLFYNVASVGSLSYSPNAKATEIGEYAFYGCKSLTSVSLPASVTTIGGYAFRNAGTADEVEEMTVSLGSGLTTIGSYAFQSCSHLKSITLPSRLTTIKDCAFEYSGLTGITIPSSVTSIEAQAFNRCGSLTNVRFNPASEKLAMIVGYYGSFSNSGNDMEVFVDREMEFSDSSTPFGSAKVSNVVIGPNVAAITPYLFYNVESVASVSYSPNAKATEIGTYAFYGCKSLSSVSLPASVTTIGDYAFRNAGTADGVEEMTVSLGSGLTTIGGYAFNSCTNLKSITLPSRLTTIKDSAFENSGLTGITIPASVTSIEAQAFNRCSSLTNVRFEPGSEKLAMIVGYYGSFSNSGNDMEVFVDREMELSDGGTPFGSAKVSNVVIGPNVAAITPYLFYDVASVSSVSYSPNAKATEIGMYAFSGCKSLSSVSLPASVTTIGDYAFRYAGSADDVEEMTVSLGSSLITIGSYAFQSCSHLKSITLPSHLTTIKSCAFENSGLTSVTIPSSVTSIESQAFNRCYSLTNTRINDSDTPLSLVCGYYGSFQNCSSNVNVYIGRDITLNYIDPPFPFVERVEFGSKVTTLQPYLLNTNKLMTVVVPWTEPIAITENVFHSDTYQNGKLLVPAGTKAKYVAADVWKKFFTVDVWSVIVKLTATGHGSIVTEYGTATNGTIQFNQPKDESLVYTLTAENGYKLTALTDNGTAISPLPALGTAQTRAIAEGEENITLAATFAPISYTISYNLAGGALASGVTNPTSYNVETATFTLNNPTRNYYDFAGWTGTGLDAPTKTVTIAKGSTGNRSYTATWTPKTYTVTITGAGVTASNYSPKYGESVVITIADDPDRTLVKLTVNNQDVTSQVVNGQYTITNVSSDIEVVATFRSTKEFITLTGEYATFSCPQDLDFSGSSLRAYIASGFNKATSQVLLTPVTDVPAGTGIFLVGNAGQTYKIPYSESTSYYVNLFQPNLQRNTIYATAGNYSNYTFGEQDGDPGFYPINGSTTLLAQTAYLQLPTSFVSAGVKVSVVFEDDIIDGIEGFEAFEGIEASEGIYNLSGQRLGKTQRGINIVGGKKILVK